MNAQTNITTQYSDDDSTELLARSVLYRFAARCLADPMLSPCAQAEDARAAEAAARYLGESKLAGDAERAGKALPATLEDARTVHLNVFGLANSSESTPYEIEYFQKINVFSRTHQLADIAGFYRAFALDSVHGERPDHIAVETEFLHYLLERRIAAHQLNHGQEKESILDDAFKDFFRDHFGCWSLAFANCLSALAKTRGDEFYQAVALFLEHLATAETSRLGLSRSDLRTVRTQPTSMESTPGDDTCQGCVVKGE